MGVENVMEIVKQHGNANAPGQGVKADAGKQQFDMIPWDLVSDENAVWRVGAAKYSPNQWRNGMPLSQPFNALLRHAFALMNGQDNDPETGLPHTGHMLCCIRMMQNTLKYYPELDDRNSWSPKA